MLLLPSGVGGAFLGLTLFQMGEGSHRIQGLVVGWLYGISVWGLMRVLPVPRGRFWLGGIFAGPIPVALLMPTGTPEEERGVILVFCLVGCLLGMLEDAHAKRCALRDSAGGPRAAVPAGTEPSGRGEP